MADHHDIAPEGVENNENNAQTSLILPSEPCLRSGESTRYVFAEWLIALIPICLWSFFLFGGYVLLPILLSVACCMGGDMLVRYWRRKKDALIARYELTPVLIGLFIAFLLPSDAPIWLTVLTALIATAAGALFGSMSACPICLPALTLCIVRAIFPTLTDIELRLNKEDGRQIADLLAAGEKPESEIVDLLLGRNDGMVGEIATLLILLAAAYLIFRKHISWHFPLAWIVGGALTAYLTAPETMSAYYYAGAQLFTGGFMLVGCLIAAHRSTAPITAKAGLLLGLIGGVLTILFRKWLGVDGALLAALIVSLPARPLDRWLAPMPFGGRKR